MSVNNNLGVYNQIFRGTPYVLVDTKTVNGRIVEKYCFNNQVDQASTRAAQAVRTLLANHNNLQPTFITNQNTLEAEVARNIYLTINGHAVSLASTRAAVQGAPEKSIDCYFSETLIQEPTRCPQGHQFELGRARIWAANKQNVCPVENNTHLIGNLVIDDEIQDEIEHFTTSHKEQHQEQKNQIERQQVLVIHSVSLKIEQQKQASHVSNDQVNDQVSQVAAGTMGRILGRVALTKGGKQFCMQLSKTVVGELAKEGGKGTGKVVGRTFVKKLPFVSIGVGIVASCYRVYYREWLRAGGELFSGVVACVPGYGTAVSVCTDVIIASCDIHEINRANSPPKVQEELLNLKTAYEVIGIDIGINKDPTKEQVDHSYQARVALLQLDKTSLVLKDFDQKAIENMAKTLQLCKAQIYQARKWT